MGHLNPRTFLTETDIKDHWYRLKTLMDIFDITKFQQPFGVDHMSPWTF